MRQQNYLRVAAAIFLLSEMAVAQTSSASETSTEGGQSAQTGLIERPPNVSDKAWDAYKSAKTRSARWLAILDRFLGPDREYALQSIASDKQLISAFEEGTEADHEKALQDHFDRMQRMLNEKPILGYQYNVFLKEETAIPLTYALYTDTDLPYLKVGDGELCTVVTLQPVMLLGLMPQFARVSQWAEQCYQERMDARKSVVSFENLSIEFVSQEKGDHCYLDVRVKGPLSAESMVAQQRFRMSLFNWLCFGTRVRNTQDAYEARQEERQNSEKLR